MGCYVGFEGFLEGVGWVCGGGGEGGPAGGPGRRDWRGGHVCSCGCVMEVGMSECLWNGRYLGGFDRGTIPGVLYRA